MQDRKSIAAIAAGCGLALAPAAVADTFNDLASFLAAAPGATLVNFDTLPGGGPAALGPIGAQYAAVGLSFPPANEITSAFFGPVSPPNGWINDTFVGSDPTFDVDITASGIRAVGVHNVSAAAPNGAVLRAFDSGGAVLEMVRSDSDGTTRDFFGVTTDADIARVVINVIDAGGWGLDDLYVGESSGGSGLDIRIDFGTAFGSTPGNWNNVDNYSGLTPDLIDYNSGAGTGVSVDGLGGPWRSFVADTGGEFLDKDWVIQPCTQDAAGLSTDLTGEYLFSNLPDGTYKVECVLARTTFDYLNTVTINGDLADRTFNGTPVFTPWGATSHGLSESNWLIWDDVQAVGGQIRLVNVAGPGTLGILNAVRISGGSAGPSCPPCLADCDESGTLDFFDFLCFQNLFGTGDPCADCDGTGTLDFFDFLCFQNAFAAGCGPSGITQLGDGRPPSELCGGPIRGIPADPRPTFSDVTTVPTPIGDIVFDIACSHRVIGGGWGTWSHGYTGDVYYTNGASSLQMSLPPNSAFYFYAEPNPFALIEFEITDGTDTVVESINGSSGAKGYGFCDAKRVGVRTTDGVTDFAVGEFGIAN